MHEREVMMSYSVQPFSGNPVSVQRILDAGALRTFFQPIVSVRRKRVMGIEALVRAVDPETLALLTPRELFDAAHAQGLLHALDRAARNLALRNFAAGSFPDQLLFLNIDLDAITTDRRIDEMLSRISALQIPAGSLVVELLESQFDQTDRLNNLVTRLREHGMLIAIDDVGSGHSNLERISVIKPDILKIDRSLCSKLGSDPCTEEVFSALVTLGRRIGSLVVAEGIETNRQAVVALERGADLLQGYLIARPESSETIDLGQAMQATHTVAGQFRQHMVAAINHGKIERRMNNILLDSVLSDLTLVEVPAFTPTLIRTLRSHPDVECAYVLDHRGMQVTDTIFNVSEVPASSVMFKPAESGTDHSLKVYYHALLDNETNRFITEPYVSLASGQMCRTISSMFRDGSNDRLFVLCIDVKAN